MAKGGDLTKRDIESNRIFFLYGEERYLIDEAIDKIVKNYLDESFIDFNLDKISEENVSSEVLSNALYSMPVMSEYRVSVINNIDKMNTQVYDSVDLFLSKDVDTTILIVTAHKPDMRKKFFKNLTKGGVGVQFKPKSEKDLYSWVNSYMSSKGKKITPEAINIVISTVKDNIKSIQSELDKILLFSDAPLINEDIVTPMLGLSKEYNIFKLQERVVKRDLGESLKIVSHMLKMKENRNDPIGINLYFSKLFISAFMISSNSRKNRIAIKKAATDLGFTNPWRDRDIISCAENFTLMELSRAIKYFLECDIKLKSGYQDSETVMLLLFEKVLKHSSNRDVKYLNYFNTLVK